ncbi:MAG: DM13 domain-containing protein [Chloroflexi bacterium]|nr:DM13 domain-containing protein [Chloroflexota bacterium]
MDIAGDFERILSEDLYPYRYPLTIAFAVAFIAALAIAYRLGWHTIAWRHRLITGPALVITLVVAIPLGDYFLSPLWERNTVCEVSPIAGAGSGSEKCDDSVLASTNPQIAAAPDIESGSASPPAANDAPASAFEPHVVSQGQFEDADDFHTGSGTALLIENEPGVYVLRLEDFSVRNGPDLFVYLSPNPDGYDDAAINLGALKGTDGAFNYDVPPGTDVSQFQSAIVWCKAFGVLFTTAPFTLAP